MKLISLTIENFKGLRSFVFRPDGRSVTVKAANGAGKSTLMDAYWWLLAGGDGAIIVAGNGSVAKAKKGSLIVLAERDAHGNICDFCARIVDGDEIKEDVLYRLDSGTLKEAE